MFVSKKHTKFELIATLALDLVYTWICLVCDHMMRNEIFT